MPVAELHEVTTILLELELVPHGLIHLAVYVPDVNTSIEVVLVVTPLLHTISPEQVLFATRVTVLVGHRLLIPSFAEIIGGIGVPLSNIVITLDEPLVPHALVHVAVKVPVLTVVVVPIAALLQVTVPLHPAATSVAVSATPVHSLCLSEVIMGAVGLFVELITTKLERATPQLFSHVALKVPATETMILLVVAPVLHCKVAEQPVAVRIALSTEQILFLSEITVGAFGAPPVEISAIFEELLVPQVELQVALYVPARLTVRLEPVAFVLHFTVPLQPDADRVAVSLSHKLFLLVLITGGAGVLLVEIMIGVE